MNDYTVVVGIDAHTIAQLYMTFPTWRKMRRGLFRKPWVIFYDSSKVTGLSLYELDKLADALNIRQLRFIPWNGDYHTQREKMVTGHVYVARQIKTPWFLKVDTDAIAYGNPKPFPDQQWFEPDASGNVNAMVASSWGYTRAKGGGPLDNNLWEWCRALERFGDEAFPDTKPLDIISKITSLDHPKGPRMRMTRLASWLCIQNTAWVRRMADKLEEFSGTHRLPVPSHDTSLWYAAVRSGERFSYARMKTYGWMVRANNNSIRAESANVMNA